MKKTKILSELGIETDPAGKLIVFSPIDGLPIGQIGVHNDGDFTKIVEKAHDAFRTWRLVPPPKRGELIRLYGEELRANKEKLARLITLENGKIFQESLGEVQEMIDICDFALGLSRQLYGLTIASERSFHRMMETWHPLGPIGVISPFNFPAAVWCWNFALAIVCGNSVIWKPSETTPLTALASCRLFQKAAARIENTPENLLQLLIGGRELGEKLAESPSIPLISATGSVSMGKAVSQVVGRRLGRVILELGGNNGMIVAPSADLDLALRAIAFSACGTAGQRCTTLRRLFVHKTIYKKVADSLKSIYSQVKVGNPFEKETLVGPLINEHGFHRMQRAIELAKAQGGGVTGGERLFQELHPQAFYVRPALIEMPGQTAIVREETFAPILYLMSYENFEKVLQEHNDVPQGLSSSIFTNDLKEAEFFLSASGSDCGIANVNIGPSGAEIGGAFGGEKETGGGRESGSDAWKNYMRRATNTINYSSVLPLAQGIQFDILQETRRDGAV